MKHTWLIVVLLLVIAVEYTLQRFARFTTRFRYNEMLHIVYRNAEDLYPRIPQPPEPQPFRKSGL